jgi:hypothetical protein
MLGKMAIIEFLVKSGADTTLKNEDGKSAFYQAMLSLGDKPDAAAVAAIDALLGPDSQIPKELHVADDSAVEVVESREQPTAEPEPTRSEPEAPAPETAAPDCG